MDHDISPTGWVAVFKPYRTEPVVGWDEHGYALIIDAARGRRVAVHDLDDHDFQMLEPVDSAYIAALPATGWTLEWADGIVEELAGFAVLPDGITLPLLAAPGGAHARPYVAYDGEPHAQLVPPGGAK